MGQDGGSSLHFLVVDDDVESRSTVVEYLRTLGHDRISEASDGAEAVRLLDQDSSINFVISDWEMPLINGFNLLQRVKSNPLRAQMPFLIMTSPVSEETEKIVLAAENMVDAYIIKPFRRQVLQDKIDGILGSALRGPQKRIVVVDDDNDARAMMVEYLQQMGFKDLVEFEDGINAMAYLSQNGAKVGLIVSDWEMPGMSGVELLRAVKQSSALGEVPFLMVTSQSSVERMKVLQAARANVDQYLLKPFTSEEMRKRILHLIEKSRTRGQVQALLDEAADHLEHGRFPRAAERFEEILKLDSTNEVALRGMGDVLLKTKGVELALPFYKRAVEASPSVPIGYVKLCMAYEQIGWIDKGIALLQSATKTVSFSADLHFHLGRLYNKKNYLDLARVEFEKTLEIQLDHQEARLMLSMLGHKSGRKPE